MGISQQLRLVVCGLFIRKPFAGVDNRAVPPTRVRRPLDKARYSRQVCVMRTPLPGPAIIAAMMLAAAIVSAVTIVGPIPVKYELLKDFQPIVAAAIALGAGTLAYVGAMAKVSLDRSIHLERENSRRSALLTRTGYSALIFYAEAENARRKVVPAILEAEREIAVGDFTLIVPPEFDEAWNNLDLLSRAASTTLANIRFNFSLLQGELSGLRNAHVDKRWTLKWSRKVPDELQSAIDLVAEIAKYAKEFAASFPRDWDTAGDASKRAHSAASKNIDAPD
jgi:hypothetical protein